MTMTGVEAAAVRAKRGARWLDENFPGWEDRINTQTLELRSGQNCICGQVFKGHARGLPSGFSYANLHLFGEANSWISPIVAASNSGRNGTPDDLLNRAWRAELVSMALGFERGRTDDGTVSGDVYVDYDDLQEAWVALLEKRRET